MSENNCDYHRCWKSTKLLRIQINFKRMVYSSGIIEIPILVFYRLEYQGVWLENGWFRSPAAYIPNRNERLSVCLLVGFLYAFLSRLNNNPQVNDTGGPTWNLYNQHKVRQTRGGQSACTDSRRVELPPDREECAPVPRCRQRVQFPIVSALCRLCANRQPSVWETVQTLAASRPNHVHPPWMLPAGHLGNRAGELDCSPVDLVPGLVYNMPTVWTRNSLVVCLKHLMMLVVREDRLNVKINWTVVSAFQLVDRIDN